MACPSPAWLDGLLCCADERVHDLPREKVISAPPTIITSIIAPTLSHLPPNFGKVSDAAP